MKKFGLHKDMKNLKSFKFCLASRSTETMPLENPGQRGGDEDGDVQPEPDDELMSFRDPNARTINRDSIKNRDSDASKFETLY